MTPALSYTGETVRKHDPDRFLLSLFAPPEVREDLWALYAFNHEIAKTREVVTETRLGLIRLQWWRDALAAIYERGEVLKHQVVEPLAVAINKHNLPRDLFDNMIYAREFDLEDRLPANLEGMARYAEFTAAPLLALSLLVQDVAADKAVIDAAATSYALTGLLRAVPAHLRQRRCYLPEDMIAAEGVTVYDLYDGTGVDKLKPVVRSVASLARNGPVAKNKFIKLHLALSGMYLGQIEGAGYDLFSPRLKAPPLLKEIRLGYIYLTS